MLRLLGSTRRLCDGMTRRDVLRVGGVGGLSLAARAAGAGVRPQHADGGGTFGRAKRIILLYLYGAAAQHETFDPKPDAPAEIRGKFEPIATAAPGVFICEHLPRLAQFADRVTFIRSMTHPYNIHSAAYTLSGVEHVDIPMELDPYDNRHWPFFGSVLDYLSPRDAAAAPQVPRNIALPFRFSSRCGQFDRGGPYGGFLGRAWDPVWTEFDGRASGAVQRWTGSVDESVDDPYAGIAPESRLTVSRAAQLPGEITLDRLDRRRSLLDQLDDGRRRLDRPLASRSLDRFQQMAYSLMTSTKLREALDLRHEPDAVRESYGMTLFGQATLAGRRLLEAGAPVVSVFWDEYGPANSAWDTHFNHYERLEHELLPGLDAALSSLLADLEQRGMLDDTLVMCLTEHGRTPKLSDTPRGAGREHWSNAYCNLLAGGGVARGRVIGSSDEHGAFVRDDPVSPKDVLCTMYHLVGIDPHRTRSLS
ncbi:MAG: DUF1501 domain-containing protein, partial [Planctomycetes bacterium]|nr:DUF1501 domain-containing protein [Planctomycetota bacterium]